MKKDMKSKVKNSNTAGREKYAGLYNQTPFKNSVKRNFMRAAAFAGTLFYLSAAQTAFASEQSWHNPDYNLSKVKSIVLTEVRNESKTVVGRPSAVNPEASYSSFVMKDKAKRTVADTFLYTLNDRKYKVKASVLQENSDKAGQGNITTEKNTDKVKVKAISKDKKVLSDKLKAPETSEKALKVYGHAKDKKGRIEAKELRAEITLLRYGYAMTVVPAHEETKVAYVRKVKKAADRQIVTEQQTVKVEDGKVSSSSTIRKTEVKKKHDNFFSDDFNDFMDDFHRKHSPEEDRDNVTDELLIPVPFTEKVPERKFYTAHVDIKYELFDAVTGEKVYMATDSRSRAGETRTESMLERSIKAMLKDMKKH